jgi:hypothetical protein
VTKCLDCGAVHPITEWATPVISASSTFGNDARGPW